MKVNKNQLALALSVMKEAELEVKRFEEDLGLTLQQIVDNPDVLMDIEDEKFRDFERRTFNILVNVAVALKETSTVRWQLS